MRYKTLNKGLTNGANDTTNKINVILKSSFSSLLQPNNIFLSSQKKPGHTAGPGLDPINQRNEALKTETKDCRTDTYQDNA